MYKIKKQTLALTALASCLMAGFMATAVAQTTTLGTRALTSSALTPVTRNANATWGTYERKEDYPRAITLPLQYITTSTGDKLAVRVSVPANILGMQASGKFPVILTQTAYRIGV